MRSRIGRLAPTLLLGLVGCSWPSSFDAVTLTAEQKATYWTEVQRRVPSWFRSIGAPAPAIPSREEVFAEARFVEVPTRKAATCYFDPPRTLEIREDLWDSGCVPHELGHLALFMVKHPCWREWEHPGEEDDCLRK